MAPRAPASGGGKSGQKGAKSDLSVGTSGGKKAADSPLYAALDLGTNSCRMLIARPNSDGGDGFHIVDSFSKTVQLGLGLEQSGRLNSGSMARTVQALKICRQKLRRHNIPKKRMRLVATEACRRASNGRAFMQRITRETGLALDVIHAQEEARLAVISCASLVGEETEKLLVVDVGGGSTELVWMDLEHIPPQNRSQAIMNMTQDLTRDVAHPDLPRVVDWISVPLGVSTLQDQFRDVSEDSSRFALMSWFFEENLSNFIPYGEPHLRKGFQIIGTSGTITTLAATHLGLRRYDRTKVDGLNMTSEQIDAVIQTYLKLGPHGRRNDPRIGRDRQALIMSGSAIIQALLRVWPTDLLSVADRGLREGLLYAQMSADGVFKMDEK